MDEVRCHPTQPFRCPGGTNICISIQYLCDGAPDCPDGYDEDSRLCTAGTFSLLCWKRDPAKHICQLYRKQAELCVTVSKLKRYRSIHLLPSISSLKCCQFMEELIEFGDCNDVYPKDIKEANDEMKGDKL